MEIPTPWLLFLGDVEDAISGKTSLAIAYWRPERCVGQLRLEGCRVDVGLEDLSAEEARSRGARAMIVGTVNPGGALPEHWTAAIVGALEAGLDVASGMHQRLADVPEIYSAAQSHGRRLFDIRHPSESLPCGTGEPRSGRRLLTVGTDCSVGKMFTSLALEKEMRARGMKVDFRATGQTGIFISGSGICVDAVVSDFIAGAAEVLSPAGEPDHWDVIEGQGSLYHPSFAGVTLGLIHGAQPEALVLCHEPTRSHMRGRPRQALPTVGECLEGVLGAARLTHREARVVGISVNTSGLTEAAAHRYLAELEEEHGLPAVDPTRTGVGRIVDALDPPAGSGS
ncbi:MAG: DUF1611 domain-containing protein [Deltaproteobacteria bacterium]|nr:DUF1611 domain-containing protein [Deltaproteobacteria bacterium]